MLKCLNVKMTEKGSSLFLTILIMSILLGVSLGISTLLIKQIRIIKGVGDSVVAFYAADSGIEKAIYAYYKAGVKAEDINFFEEQLGNGSFFSVRGYKAGEGGVDCLPPNQYYCIKSVGTYNGVRRAIEVSR